jgi:hypothetical protein
MRDQERALDRLFVTLSQDLGREVMRWADADGVIPRESTYALQQRVAQQVMSVFLTERGGRMASYTLAANGMVQPLSPYMRILWGSIEAATAIPVEQQAVLMRRHLPPDLIVRLALANREAVAVPVQEQGPIFRPNPLASYDAPHLWLDPNGYRLSDRIWRTASDTRRRVDMFLEEGIAQGRSARDIAADLEQFLQPGRQLKRTTAPYGTDASYDAMRLARTEVSRAAASASQASAAMNPFVAGLKWNLSPQHPCGDVCDTYAAGGPYPVDGPPTMPAHPHCVTPGQIVATARGPVPIEQIVMGDEVLTHAGHYKLVTKAWSRSHEGWVYEIETEQGRLELTGDHPVLLSRGWVKAQDLQPSDQLLYASIDVPMNLAAVESEYQPAKSGQVGVARGIVTGIMPAAAITFDSDVQRGERKVDEVAPKGMLAQVGDPCLVEGGSHSALNASRIAETPLALGFEHWPEPRIVPLLDARDLAADFGSFGGIVVSDQVNLSIDVAEEPGSPFAPRAIILFPACRDGVATVAHGNIVDPEHRLEHPIGEPVLSENGWGTEPLGDIDLMEQFLEWSAVFGFKAQRMEIGDCHAVRAGVGQGGVMLYGAANGASEAHDNLLMLSPDSMGGAGSGKPVVGGVASPSQALQHYSTIRAIRKRVYRGLVYNMEVADDNSYTVNGAVVHNCLCYWTYELVDNPREVVAALQEEARSSRRDLLALVGPVQLARFVQMLLRGLSVSTPGGAIP